MSGQSKRFVNVVALMVLVAVMHGSLAAQAAPKKPSIWQKVQNAAKAQQQGQQPGQKPGQAGAKPPTEAPGSDFGPFTPPAGTKIEPVVVAPVEQGGGLALSPLGVHVAELSHSGSRPVIIYDVVVGPKFDSIFMLGGVGQEAGVIVSPDSKRYAYCGRSGDQIVTVLDGKQIGQSPSRPQAPIAGCSFRRTASILLHHPGAKRNAFCD